MPWIKKKRKHSAWSRFLKHARSWLLQSLLILAVGLLIALLVVLVSNRPPAPTPEASVMASQVTGRS